MRQTKWAVALAIAVGVSLALSFPAGTAAPAHFWITDNAVTPHGPDTPTDISIEEGLTGTLYIWGRAETGKKLRNFSLNLVAMQAGVDFIDGTYTVQNDAGNGLSRYEYTSDSSSAPAINSEESLFDVRFNSQTDAVEGLQGYSITDSSATIRGAGGTCVDSETGCITATDGQPAWLIASVEYNAVIGGPVTELHLQIGKNGVNHESLVSGDYDYNGVVDTDDFNQVTSNFSSTLNLWADGNGSGLVDAADYTIWRDHLGSVSEFEVSSLTSVRFGADTSDGVDEPIYNGDTDKETTLAMDDPDATITITAAGPIEALQSVPEPSSAVLLLGLIVLSVRTFSCSPR
ncbi:MAG: hypothetical protein AAGD11_15200 [Planctomycetota bacterium]